MSTLQEQSKAKDVLNREIDGIQPPPRIADRRVEFGFDAAGDPAVFVTLFLDENTPDEDWTSELLDPISVRLRRALSAAGVDLFAYIRYAREHAGNMES